MADSIIGPTSHYFYSQRLKLHYVDWGNPDKPLLVLVHGGRDHCRNWDWVALDLRQHFHIIAPDLARPWRFRLGGRQRLLDDRLRARPVAAHECGSGEPATLIGHSLGGGIVLQYTGVFPDAVKRVVSIEGLGPPPAMIKETPAYERMKDWIGQMQTLSRRKVREYPIYRGGARADAPRPTRISAVEQARHLTIQGIRRNENGTYSWKFDNYVHATSPYMFNTKDAREIWGRITCPMLLIRGSESWAGDWVKDGRIKVFQARRDR